MTQKMAIILSAVLTAFLLVFGGAVAARVSQADAAPKPAAATPTPAQQSSQEPTADVMAQAQAIIQQRDAEYRKLIDQANQRLQAVYQQQQTIALAAQAAQTARAAQSAPVARSAPAATQPAAPIIAVSSDAATSIAVQAANGATLIRTAELVRFEGIVAYEVGFTRGPVYVDANSGSVLYNGTQGGNGGGGAAPAPASQPPSGGEHEQEHESQGHDD